MSMDKYARSNSVLSEKEFRLINVRNKPFYDIRHARAKVRWSESSRHVQSASAAFSAAGMERRRAFVEKKWYTITGPEIESMDGTQRSRSLDYGESVKQIEQEELLPKPWDTLSSSSRSHSMSPGLTGVGEKSMSFSFDDDRQYSVTSRSVGATALSARKYTKSYRWVMLYIPFCAILYMYSTCSNGPTISAKISCELSCKTQ